MKELNRKFYFLKSISQKEMFRILTFVFLMLSTEWLLAQKINKEKGQLFSRIAFLTSADEYYRGLLDYSKTQIDSDRQRVVNDNHESFGYGKHKTTEEKARRNGRKKMAHFLRTG